MHKDFMNKDLSSKPSTQIAQNAYKFIRYPPEIVEYQFPTNSQKIGVCIDMTRDTESFANIGKLLHGQKETLLV